MPDRFDMVVVGAGPAGEKAAAQAAYFDKRVAVVEAAPALGGAMAASALTTKAMREAALYLTGFKRRHVYGAGIDLHPQAVIELLRARAVDVAASMSDAVRANLARHHVELVTGTARLGPDRTVTVVPADGSAARTLAGSVVLIATGSHPFHPPGVPFDDPDVLDSETARELDRPMRSLVVVGGGAVACEYASIFMALGAEVTLVDRGAQLLPFLDSECSALVAESFRSSGMTVLARTAVAGVALDAGGLALHTDGGAVLRPEKVIFAAGRVGNTEELGLSAAGVDTDDRGRIAVDDHFRTSAPGVYAAGDVIGPPALASASMEQGRVAACYALDIPFKQTVDPLTPFGVYSIPECALVGITEVEAKVEGRNYAVGVSYFADNSRAAIAGTTEGLVKLVVDCDDRRLLGVHIVGEGATELVHQGQAVLHFGGTIDYFIHATFDVPTMSDAYKYAAYDCLQRMARSQGAQQGPA
ncbi:MAG TPA: Si-specific NAD(P)(+) transhydrogenase [Acidimicrobiales bacterium]|nr:Si-specific NAD(P)(+) transhydrogenase [Acidimicrobiales bacterium]